MRLILDVSLQRSTENIFMCVFDIDMAKGLVFRTNTPEHCGVFKTLVRAGHGDTLCVFFGGSDRAWSLPEVGVDDKFADGGSFGTNSDGGSSRRAGASFVNQ